MQSKSRLFRNTAKRSIAVPWSGRGDASPLRAGLTLVVWFVVGASLIHWFLQAQALSWSSTAQRTSIQTVEMSRNGPDLEGNLVLPPMAYVMGANPQEEDPADDTAQAPVALNVQLLGVLIHGNKVQQDSVVLMAVDGQPARVFRHGQEPMPGWQLVRIEAKQVTLRQRQEPSGEQVLVLAQPSRDGVLADMNQEGDAIADPDQSLPLGAPANKPPQALRRLIPKQP